MKSVVNYSINVKVLEAFNDEVKDQTRSRLIEALMINFLIEHSQPIKLLCPKCNWDSSYVFNGIRYCSKCEYEFNKTDLVGVSIDDFQIIKSKT